VAGGDWGKAHCLEAEEAFGTVEDVGPGMVRGTGLEAEEVVMQFPELGPLVLAVAERGQAAKLSVGVPASVLTFDTFQPPRKEGTKDV
jgi:hypothetical protein